jgi:hypothetical protein
MYAEQMTPERCGSSEKLSKLCDTKGMHERWCCGAAGLCAHTTSKWALKDDQDTGTKLMELMVRNSLTRWILQVGARIRDTALSFASEANSFNPTSSTRFLSQVAAKAVAHYLL